MLPTEQGKYSSACLGCGKNNNNKNKQQQQSLLGEGRKKNNKVMRVDKKEGRASEKKKKKSYKDSETHPLPPKLKSTPPPPPHSTLTPAWITVSYQSRNLKKDIIRVDNSSRTAARTSKLLTTTKSVSKGKTQLASREKTSTGFNRSSPRRSSNTAGVRCLTSASALASRLAGSSWCWCWCWRWGRSLPAASGLGPREPLPPPPPPLMLPRAPVMLLGVVACCCCCCCA